MSEPALIPNPYRAAVLAARGRVVPETESMRMALWAARTAWGAGAWVGGQASVFEDALTGVLDGARMSGDATLNEFDQEVWAQPREVAPGSWQARQRNL